MNRVHIFTDGCCKGNPGPGGYGCIIKRGGTVLEFKGASPSTTNNIMEMTAAIVALQKLTQPSEVELTSDSQYLIKGVTEWLPGWVRNGWKTADRKPVKNQALWEKLYHLKSIHKIRWHWVRGHSGHPENERCDALANEAMADL
jgi:ribonuclease HI